MLYFIRTDVSDIESYRLAVSRCSEFLHHSKINLPCYLVKERCLLYFTYLSNSMFLILYGKLNTGILFSGRVPNDLETIRSVRERINVFETLLTNNQVVSTRKSGDASQPAKVTKHEGRGPFQEGPSKLNNEQPKAVLYKPESSQSDAKETGKLFLTTQIGELSNYL